MRITVTPNKDPVSIMVMQMQFASARLKNLGRKSAG